MDEQKEVEMMMDMRKLQDEYFDLVRGDESKEWSDKCYEIQDAILYIDYWLEQKGL